MKKNLTMSLSERIEHMTFTLKKSCIFVLILILFLAKSTSLNAQNTITLSEQNTPLLKVLKQIERQSSYLFVYDEQNIDIKKPVSINISKVPVSEALTRLLDTSNIEYKIEGKNIVLRKKPSSTISTNSKIKKRISGVVLDENKQVVIGASIMVVGENLGAITDINGKFQLNDVDSESLLRITYIGYESTLITVGNNIELKIAIEPSIHELQEVAVTAQAIGQKNAIREQLNSNTIKNVVAADRLQENPDANSAEAIGRLPGISLQRSGGEGVGLVIRGLEPKYSNVTLNGVQLPSTGGLSGISQYALQGAEVYKALTSDMEANSVAGSVNLKLREAPKGLHSNLMVQSGYNSLNSDFGNYKYLAEFSNRFFDNKLGVLLSANAERVNRSTQYMSAAYSINGSDKENGDILIDAIGLNSISSITYRKSAMLSLDYKLSSSTTLMLYGMYSSLKNDYNSQSKYYEFKGSGNVGYFFNSMPNNLNEVFQTTLSGESKFKWLSISADYGVSFSKGNASNMDARSWNFNFNVAPPTIPITDVEHRKMDPKDLIPLFTDDPSNFKECYLSTMGMTNSKTDDQNLTAYLNFKVPFVVNEFIQGSIKFGGMYRHKDRFKDDLAGNGNFTNQNNPVFSKLLPPELDWLVLNGQKNLSAVNLTNGPVKNFLNGDYDFGYSFDMNRLNQMFDKWNGITQYYNSLPPSEALPIIFDSRNITFQNDIRGSIINDQNIQDTYVAGYIMPEINFGKYVMFMPGVRYERTNTNLKGFYAVPPTLPPTIFQPIPGQDSLATRDDAYVLPMIHLRVKPSKNFYAHFSYTQTLSRPDLNDVSPNFFVYSGMGGFLYIAKNPMLKAELWNSFDAQFVYHSPKVGLLSITGFFKTVDNKIWNRSYNRIKGDSILNPFPANSTVAVHITENHPYKSFVKGFELEWQTNFGYLPAPFKYLTFSANYTFTKSTTSYPFVDYVNVIPPGQVRPIRVRIDSLITGVMTNQPKHIANVSLGFNKNGFNAWLSFQYNGEIYTGINYNAAPRLNVQKPAFYRWDLQLAQKFSIGRIVGFEVVANIANINDIIEETHYSGETRLSSAEKYGWTTDLGLRFRF